MIKVIVLPIMVLFFSVPVLMGHGVKVTLEKKYPAVLVNARYHGGKVLVNASVSVSIRFEKEKKEFQTGKTDKNGSYCFYPDKAGQWTVTVDDLVGHRGKKTITLTDVFFTSSSPLEKEKTPKQNTPAGTEKKGESSFPGNEWCCYVLKIVLGVLLILVITYIFYRVRKRQETS